ncbi:hypothetical protein [Nocardia sp. NPDC057440]|uniref:hypothetical protein n=1 Tax=Nocardia sp. NPDC057440 TaxID=3346134 RepID=UPI003672BEE2
MPKYIRGEEPIAIWIGTTPVLKKYLGTTLIWDGTRSAVAQAQRATATALVRTADVSASASATASVATASASARPAVGTTSASGQATAATASALVLSHMPIADATATATAATVTAEVNGAFGDETFNATANATTATATATVSSPVATGAADAQADATAATATTIVYDAVGQGSSFNTATAATATATALTATVAASATAPALVATASATGKNATPSASAAAATTAATATAAANTAGGGATYSDNFNRSNGVLGSNWTYQVNTNAPTISSNVAACATSTANFYPVTWITALNGDDQVARANTSGSLTSTSAGLILRSNSGMTAWVGALFNTARVSIVTGSAPVSVTVRVQIDGNPGIASGSLLEFRAVGNVYTLYDDGVQLVQWVDSGNVATVGSSNRLGGFGVQRISTTNSVSLDNFALMDSAVA